MQPCIGRGEWKPPTIIEVEKQKSKPILTNSDMVDGLQPEIVVLAFILQMLCYYYSYDVELT